MGRSAIWLKSVIPRDCVTTVTNLVMSSRTALCQELWNINSVTTVVRLVMSRLSVPSNVVTTVTRLATFQENAPRRKSTLHPVHQEVLRSLVTDVVVQTTWQKTACKAVPNVTPVVPLVICPRTAQVDQAKKSVTTVMRPGTFLEIVQSIDLIRL